MGVSAQRHLPRHVGTRHTRMYTYVRDFNHTTHTCTSALEHLYTHVCAQSQTYTPGSYILTYYRLRQPEPGTAEPGASAKVEPVFPFISPYSKLLSWTPSISGLRLPPLSSVSPLPELVCCVSPFPPCSIFPATATPHVPAPSSPDTGAANGRGATDEA